MTELLSRADLDTFVTPLENAGWARTRDGHALSKTFVFSDFVSAFDWMSRVARIAQEMNHHPEWTNVYKTVAVTLTTHDANGVTMKDITLAQDMDKAANA
ncbi:4a-hydroxytetrahydrobiopterin dehydratase [Celeribacter marinus]|uniref:4a-hydroxytetrahydrobiopterin dehydratase n=1 Tax=Celeribacter marinus TaxID=1397108 RepID=UPI003F6BC628